MCSSNVQLKELLKQKHTAKKHRLHQANGPIEWPSSTQPSRVEVQPEEGYGRHGTASLGTDLAKGAIAGTAEGQKKKKGRNPEVEGAQQYAQMLGSPSMATQAKEEPRAAQFHTTGKAAAALRDAQVNFEPGSLPGKLSKKQRKKLGVGSGDTLGVSTPVTIKIESGADVDVQQSAFALLSGSEGLPDALPGLSKKQRKKLRTCMHTPSASTGMSPDTKAELREKPVSWKQGPANNTTAGQDSLLAGNHIAGKKRGGSSSRQRQKEKDLRMSAAGHVKEEHGLANGESHPIQHAHLEADLPVSLGKKQKRSSSKTALHTV
jgi:hypothetical protein